MSNSANEYFASEYGRRHGDESAPDPRWAAAHRRITELEQQLADAESEKKAIRQEVVAEIRATAEDSAALNQRLQAFNAEITPDMDGSSIKRLARKHGL